MLGKFFHQQKSHYLFVSQNIELRSIYDKGILLNQIFVKNTLAVVTGKDDLFIDFDKSALMNKLKLAFPNDKIEANKIKPIAYRIFDTRYIYYDNKFLERPRMEIMQNLFSGNIALNSAKYGRQLGSYNYFVTQNITSKDLTSSYDSVNTFPLFIIASDLSREVNFSSNFKNITSSFNLEISNEQILGYIYSILHSPTYRNKYSEFLKIDFPRILFTEDKNIFKQLAALGNELIDVHLLKAIPDYPYAIYLGKGADIVENPNFVVENGTGTLWINKLKRYENVPPEVYNFYIGGYKVLEHYLKDRKGRELSSAEIENIENTVKAIAFTIAQMKKINELTASWI